MSDDLDWLGTMITTNRIGHHLMSNLTFAIDGSALNGGHLAKLPWIERKRPGKMPGRFG